VHPVLQAIFFVKLVLAFWTWYEIIRSFHFLITNRALFHVQTHNTCLLEKEKKKKISRLLIHDLVDNVDYTL
jgi:hypothetical protein